MDHTASLGRPCNSPGTPGPVRFHAEQQRGHEPLREPLLVLDVLRGEAVPHLLGSPRISWGCAGSAELQWSKSSWGKLLLPLKLFS